MILSVYKKVGETPLACIKRLQKEGKIKDQKVTYAGRLDPLAEGILLLLTGKDVNKKESFLSLPKVYELSILWGIGTDTGDLLGKVTDCVKVLDIPDISSTEFVGTRQQKYPVYSSKTVSGKPLWKWAREGKISEIRIPSHQITISSIKKKQEVPISLNDLQKSIQEKVQSVSGDFRQQEVLDSWKWVFSKISNFWITSYTVDASSGTYMRMLAKEMGQKINLPSCAYSIKRLSVGDYNSVDI